MLFFFSDNLNKLNANMIWIFAVIFNCFKHYSQQQQRQKNVSVLYLYSERALGEFVHKAFCHSAIKIHPQFQGTVNKRITFKSLANGFKFRGLDPRPQYSASLHVHTWLICITIICKQIMREAKMEKVTLPFVLSLNQREGNDCFAAWSLSFSTGDAVYLDNMTWKGIHRWSDQSSSCLFFQPHVAPVVSARQKSCSLWLYVSYTRNPNWFDLFTSGISTHVLRSIDVFIKTNRVSEAQGKDFSRKSKWKLHTYTLTHWKREHKSYLPSKKIYFSRALLIKTLLDLFHLSVT